MQGLMWVSGWLTSSGSWWMQLARWLDKGVLPYHALGTPTTACCLTWLITYLAHSLTLQLLSRLNLGSLFAYLARLSSTIWQAWILLVSFTHTHIPPLIVLASRASGRHLDTQTLKNHPAGHPKSLGRNFSKCQFQAFNRIIFTSI